MSAIQSSSWIPSQRAQEILIWQRKKRYRTYGIAAAATIIFFSCTALLLYLSPGWSITRESFFSPHYAAMALPAITQGISINITLFLICSVCSFTIALLITLIRISLTPILFPLRLAAAIYVDIFRGIPVILVIYLLGFGVPSLRLPSLPVDPIIWGATAIILAYSAYISEVIRSGILAIHPAQWDAGRCLGLQYRDIIEYIILPQALKAITPALVNDMVSLQKDTSLVSVLGVIEALRAAGIIAGENFNYTPYLVAGGFFLLLTIPVTRFTDYRLTAHRRKQFGR